MNDGPGEQSAAGKRQRLPLESGWEQRLGTEFEQPYMQQISTRLRAAKKAGTRVYPPGKEIFNALSQTPFDQVRVVIFGQDPYHGRGQAQGLCFSVPPGVKPPPSLVNILRELQQDLGHSVAEPGNGCLLPWAQRGILLLNAVLTVEEGRAASHSNWGWQRFTDRIVQVLNTERDGLVFLLWGRNAKDKGQIIDRNRHLVLEASHPSPLGVTKGSLAAGISPRPTATSNSAAKHRSNGG